MKKIDVEEVFIAIILCGVMLFASVIFISVSINEQKVTRCKVKEIETKISKIEDIDRRIKDINKKIDNVEKKVDSINKKIDKFNHIANNIAAIIKHVNNKIDNKTANIIAYNIIEASLKYKVPIEYIISVMWVESHFNPHAYNKRTKCIGLMQVNPNIWISNNELSILLYGIRTNIMVGTYILRYYYDNYGNWKDAIIAYYGMSTYAKEYYVKKVLWKVKWVKKKLVQKS